MKPSTGWPSTKAITAGIDWMPELAREWRMVVDVHLDQLHLALGGLHDLLEHRGELLAGAAPGRPEIDQHRLALDASVTSVRNVWVVVSLMTASGASAGGGQPIFSSIVNVVVLAWRPRSECGAETHCVTGRGLHVSP